MNIGKDLIKTIYTLRRVIRLLLQRKMPVHIMKKIRPNPAKMDPNTAPRSSLVKDLFSLGLFTK